MDYKIKKDSYLILVQYLPRRKSTIGLLKTPSNLEVQEWETVPARPFILRQYKLLDIYRGINLPKGQIVIHKLQQI